MFQSDLGEEAQTTHLAVTIARFEEIPLLLHFSSLDLSQRILDAIAQEGYDTPTPIQAQAIPPALAGRDLLGCAQTGTGKTAAFALPILHRLSSAPVDKSRRGPVTPRALVLSPTRELANQIEGSFKVYGQYTKLRQTAIYGGVSQFHQVRHLQRGVDIIVATPGRLLDLMEQRLVDLRNIEIFVLDEADRMLDMGFIQPIRSIAKAMPAKRQTLLFSATMPRSIMHLADSLLHDPVKVSVAPVASTAALIEQSVYMAPREAKLPLLEHLLAKHGVERALIFTRTKFGADKLTRKLIHAGVKALAIHGNKAQNQRQRALESFRSGKSRVLVATDVAARGIDVDSITHVFNFDLPNDPEAYVHRIGRTGRAGATGIAISFCDGSERNHLRAIERLTGKRIEAMSVPEDVRSASRTTENRTDENRDGENRNGQKRSEGGGSSAKPKRSRSRSNNAEAPAQHQRRKKSSGGAPAFHGKKRNAAKPRAARRSDRRK